MFCLSLFIILNEYKYIRYIVLPASGSANDTNLLAGRDTETEVVEDRFTIDVFETYILELYGGRLRGHH